MDTIVAVFYFGVMLGIAYICYHFLIPALLPFLIAVFIASQLKKLTGFITRHSRVQGRVAAATSVLCFYGVVTLAIWILTTYGCHTATRMLVRLPELYTGSIGPGLAGAKMQLQERIVGIAPNLAGDMSSLFDMVLGWVGDFISRFSTSTIDGLTGLLAHLPELLLGTVFTVVLTFLITIDYQDIAGFIIRQVPRSLRQTFIDLKNFLLSTLYRLLKAYFFIMLITFAMLAVGLALLQVPGSIRLAGVIAVMDILPILGSGMVFIPWSLYCFITNNIALGAGLLLFVLIETVRNFIEPHNIGDQIGLHPVATIVASFIGLKLMGFGGVLIAPILALTAQYLNENDTIRLYK